METRDGALVACGPAVAYGSMWSVTCVVLQIRMVHQAYTDNSSRAKEVRLYNGEKAISSINGAKKNWTDTCKN